MRGLPVSFFLGEEGRGGEDQDLDEIVIRQLREENEKLKDELQILRELTASDSSIHEELSAIMRDRINDLLVANSDLEKEVVRLRYSPKEVIIIKPRNAKTIVVLFIINILSSSIDFHKYLANI